MNEGTYVTNVIIPAVRASLKNLYLGTTSFISTSERQSIASANRRKESGHSGRRPDIMFVIEDKGYVYELMFSECSQLVCNERKKSDDDIKLWREANNGISWVLNTNTGTNF
ncbi:10149_t:CDS:2 [Entrophospora sp. SA101]|nr:10149_t:CDS:2 [Entrophospora sp. SA101]